MAKKNELPALIASLALTVALLGGGAWWLKDRLFVDGGGGSSISQNGGDAGNTSGSTTGGIDINGNGTGASVLPVAVSPTKQKGLEALAAGDYNTAKVEFTTALNEQKNDPESLIYLNNAEIGDGNAHLIAISVPAGASVNTASELLRGAAQAQTDINESGGINGTPIKLLLVNDNDDSEQAKTIATELVNNPDVLGVVGHYSSGTTLAAAEVYEAGKLPMVSATSTAVSISTAGDYIFRTVPSDRLAAGTLSRFVIEKLNKQKAAVFFTSDSTYSKSVKSEFTQELLTSGGEVVIDFDVSEPGFSAGRAVQAANDAGADVIMLALTTNTIDAANQVISVNASNLPLVGGDSMYNVKVLDVGRENAEGLTVAVPWHILSHEGTDFVSTSRNLWGGDVNWRTATAYDAVQALAAGLSRAPNREGLAAALADTSLAIDGATNPIRFLPSGDRNQPSQLVEVVPGTRSGTGFDYEPVN
ncbi:MAG: ABC transporter substrate-binding protein [Cyanobacteria bacterium J06649_4]